jgi:hypothetical protein
MRNTLVSLVLTFFAVGGITLAGEKVPVADLPTHAIRQSQITLAGSPAFHLKAKVFEKTDRDNDSHNAEIVEDWVAPDKWRRTIEANGFAENMIVNGNNISQTLTGDYYPNWLRTLVSGIFNPGAALDGIDLTKSGDSARLEMSPDGKFRVASDEGPEICRRFGIRVSSGPASNTVFAAYCFRDALLESIVSPGYDVSYTDYKKFGDKQVARKVGEYIESGTELEADIEELELLSAPDEAVFAVASPSPQLHTLVVGEQTLRSLIVNAPDIDWPPMNGGRNPGTLSIYVCLDRQGHVRETYPLNSDSPDMEQAAREQVMKWTFKPAVTKSGEAVQVESVLTFGYHAPPFPQGK